MYRDMTLTVVMPAYNEEPNIAAAVKAFLVIPEVDEILVVNNNSTDRTDQEARGAGARVVLETRQGYGYACQRGLIEADSDLVVIVEPDGTFRASDLYKFFPYVTEWCEHVVCSATRQCYRRKVTRIYAQWAVPNRRGLHLQDIHSPGD